MSLYSNYKYLMSELSAPTLSLIGVIAVAVAVPKYIKMPESLELLFNDRMGQILLLGLSAVIGSYNFAVGLMVAVFFMTLMVSGKSVEGFDNHMDMDFEEDFKETVNEDDEPVDKKPKKANTNTCDNTARCDNLEKSIENLQVMQKEMGCMVPKTKAPKSEDDDEPLKSKDEDLVEGFGCGCPGTVDSMQRKMYLEEAGENVENFKNQMQPQPLASTTLTQGQVDFDVVGCRYDLKQTGLNDDVYGPPLSSCNAYQAVNLEETGTVFYPLN
jgi:hypothetical protein